MKTAIILVWVFVAGWTGIAVYVLGWDGLIPSALPIFIVCSVTYKVRKMLMASNTYQAKPSARASLAAANLDWRP